MSLAEQLAYYNQIKQNRRQRTLNNLQKIHQDLLMKAREAGYGDNIEAYIASIKIEMEIADSVTPPTDTNHIMTSAEYVLSYLIPGKKK